MESVDRNTFIYWFDINVQVVALRMESVDRNTMEMPASQLMQVALRMESVDRNKEQANNAKPIGGGRSPYGERG